MSQILITMSGRKGAGKNTIARFIAQYYASKLPLDKRFPELDKKLSDFHKMRLREQLAAEVCLECSFADSLKEFCIGVLGLEDKQCYGTDEEKESLTKYKWENAPKFIRWKFGDEYAKSLVAEGRSQDELMDAFHKMLMSRNMDVPGIDLQEPVYKMGQMSGRDIMKIFGTDLIRETFGNVWAQATIRKIKRSGKLLAIITDNRFPNEVECILKEPQSYIIRLTRMPFGKVDGHPSEAALDHYDWNRANCFVLDNAALTIEEQNEAVKPILDKIFAEKSK